MASDKTALQGSILELVLFNDLISDLKEVTECTLIKFAIDAKLGGGPMLKGRATIQRELGRLEGWANLVKFKELLDSPEESDCDPHNSCRAAEPQGWLCPFSKAEKTLLCALPHTRNENQD